jgi:hypothetical protein
MRKLSPVLLVIAEPLKIGAVYCNSGVLQALDEPSWREEQADLSLRNK